MNKTFLQLMIFFKPSLPFENACNPVCMQRNRKPIKNEWAKGTPGNARRVRKTNARQYIHLACILRIRKRSPTHSGTQDCVSSQKLGKQRPGENQMRNENNL